MKSDNRHFVGLRVFTNADGVIVIKNKNLPAVKWLLYQRTDSFCAVAISEQQVSARILKIKYGLIGNETPAVLRRKSLKRFDSFQYLRQKDI